MLAGEVNHVHWLVEVLRQVVDVEVLRFVDHEELAQTAHEAARVGVVTLRLGVEVQQTPFQLTDRVLARLVPDSHRRRVIIVVQSKQVTKSVKLTL